MQMDKIIWEFAMRMEKELKKIYSQAFKYYKLSADQGNSNGQNNLGYCYANGKGTEQDLEMAFKAFKYYKLSADQGNANGQYNLGYCYDNGQGTEKNVQLQGNANGQNSIQILQIEC
eukprot:TRINITY_DN4162_c0_g1_i8.p3 TRINITY_DN4162_c0_g1~~TRINITY_DN4162_c0_g1_i8.p3  ORF type:complete len:117 (+),score=33.51 TRINITY_DN4162_c0_g1_i8:226-576(+)